MVGFFDTVREQRWDDHRLYHHSRINQSLHFISALSFLVAYVLLFIDPPMAALVAWVIGMWSRQSGHFFFEPRGFDQVNQVTHDHKEEIKIGYNLRRKVVLMALWAVLPLALLVDPTLFGVMQPHDGLRGYARSLGTLWLILGLGGLVFRTIHLFFLYDVKTGLAWCAKIITDPFNDIKLYWKSPLALMRGELIDPMLAVKENRRH
jgi:hypothetical protein